MAKPNLTPALQARMALNTGKIAEVTWRFLVNQCDEYTEEDRDEMRKLNTAMIQGRVEKI